MQAERGRSSETISVVCNTVRSRQASESQLGFLSTLRVSVTIYSVSQAALTMSTLDQVLETALQLSYEQQEMLIKILQNRHHQSRRAEIAADAQQSLVDFRAGKFRPQSSQSVIAELRQSLDDAET